MDLLLIVTLMLIGSGVGALFGRSPDATIQWITLTSAAGGVMGAVSAYALIAALKATARAAKPPKARTRSRDHPASPAIPFHRRVARFVDKDEGEVLTDDGYRSKMPFWIAVDAIVRFPPKSASLIRTSLLQIRQTLRG